MSAQSNPTDQHPPGQSPSAAADPSMEDILASIRRILSEEEAPPATGPNATGPKAAAPAAEEDVFILDPSMMVDEQHPVHSDETYPHEAQPHDAAHVQASGASAPAPLVAPAAAAAAASSVGSLVRTLSSRTAQVHAGGPTIEDIVRDEIRPMLKQWLDANLPPLVERLVRTEIERVVGRAEL